MTTLTPRQQAGLDAEQRVLAALRRLPTPWQTFHAVEWRLPGDHGERIGEADIIVFHPQHGLIVLEVKSGQLSLRNGQWYQGERVMQKSPFAQARHNLYALKAKLEQRLGKDNLQYVALTHAAWFPGCVWRKDTPLMDVPSAAFVLDRETLEAPEPALLRLLREAAPDARPWHTSACNAVKELLAADCQLLMPMRWRIADAVDELMQATEDQMRALRLLRGQSRLLVRGGAGSGKTLLALNLAREQANAGKTVLLTCFNRYLAQQLAEALADRPGVTVLTFHDLTAHWARQAGLAYVVPNDAAAQSAFYREGCAELLMQAAETLGPAYDSILVDEGADFPATWWLALEALGRPGFRWHCFYDLNQRLYWHGEADWQPPFAADVMELDCNLRNTRPVGGLAAQLGCCADAREYRVEDGPAPIRLACTDFEDMARQLRKQLRVLTVNERIAPENILVLSPYKHTNAQSVWAKGLDEVTVSADWRAEKGKVRVGTIQGFKGLEADVVILAGITPQALTHPDWMYVGASRARVLLVMLHAGEYAPV